MTYRLFGYRIFSSGLVSLKDELELRLKSPLKRCLTINCVNPHSYVMSKYDLDFRKSLLESDILLPDGIGITLAAKLNGHKVDRITGHDVFEIVMNIANDNCFSVLFLGGNTTTLGKIQSKIFIEYPNLKDIYTFSPPFKKDFSLQDNEAMLEFINSINPDIIFVGMSAPKQEKWSFRFKNKVNTKCVIGIGAVFDFYVGNVKRSPRVFRNFGLEWLPRLIQEPGRLANRTFVSAPIFVFDVIFNFFKRGE